MTIRLVALVMLVGCVGGPEAALDGAGAPMTGNVVGANVLASARSPSRASGSVLISEVP